MDGINYARVVRVLAQQKHSCGNCGEDLDPALEVALLQVVRPYRFFDEAHQIWKVGFHKQLDYTGDFAHHPYFFHDRCWQECSDNLTELVEHDTPSHVNGAHVCQCSYCKSDVAEGELLGIVHYGTLVLSPRQPNMMDVVDYTMDHAPILICSSCLNELNMSVLELWPEDTDLTDAAVEYEGRRIATWGSGNITSQGTQ